jgi:hypothetical protein
MLEVISWASAGTVKKPMRSILISFLIWMPGLCLICLQVEKKGWGKIFYPGEREGFWGERESSCTDRKY